MTTIETSPAVVGLSKTDIAALRKADDVYAHFRDGNHFLSATKRATFTERERDPFARDITIEVPVEGVTLVYRDGERVTGAESSEQMVSAFTSLWNSSGIWEILRPGDRVRLRWSKNGGKTGGLTEVGLVGDILEIEVIRKHDLNGRKPLRFLGAYYSGHNNSARMCH